MSTDPALLHKLAQHLDAARELAKHPRPMPNRFARGDFEERPWRGDDRLFVHVAVTAVEVRYVVDKPARRSWEFSFKPTLTAEELFNWLASLR